MKNHFVASDGITISFVEGWFNKTSHAYKGGMKDFNEHVQKTHIEKSAFPSDYGFFLDKVMTYNTLVNLLKDSLGTNDLNFQNTLDIATGPAVYPRLFKANGISKYAIGIDILDRENVYSDETIIEQLNFLKNTLLSHDSPDKERISSISQRVSDYYFGIEYPLDFSLFDIPKNKDISLDKYVTDDFLNVELDEKFDLITAISCQEYFNSDDLFKRLYDLLNPGGIIIIMATNFYELFAGAAIVPNDFPWMHTILTRDDFTRYYEEIHPDYVESLKIGLYYNQTHMTPIDWINSARNNGLELVSHQRNIHEDYNKNIFYNKAFTNLIINDILPRAKIINPTVKIADFFTRTNTFIYKKPK